MAFTLKLCVTGAAAAYCELPACEAWIVHVPAASSVALVPETEQMVGVLEAKLTASPEVEDAVRLSDPPTLCAGMAPKVMVWDLSPTLKLCVTGAAAAYCELPACEAWIEHVPAASMVALVPDTEQMAGVLDAKLTASPEVEDAVRLSVPPTDCAGMAPKVIVWDLSPTLKLCVTGTAAAYCELPVCEAWIEHVPAASIVAVVPETEHTVGVVEAKLTANPESEEAARVSVPPTDCGAI